MYLYMDVSHLEFDIDRYRADVVDNALDHIEKYSFSQADPQGKPSHGRDYDREGTKTKLLLGDPNIIAKAMALKLSDDAKADLLLLYANAVNINNQLDDSSMLDELLSYINSLSLPVVTLPVMPIWCTPDGIKIFNLRATTEDHYRKRTEAIMALYNSSSDTASLYNFILNYTSYFYIDSECLCRLTTGGKNRLRVKKAFGEGKVGKAYMVLDQTDNPYIMKSINNIGPGRIQLRFTTLDKKDMSPATGIAVKSQRDELGFVSVGMDDFTNQTVMHLLLNLLLADCPNYVYQYDAFKCTTGDVINGYNIMDIANGGDMAKYLNDHPEDVLEICEEAIRQLFPVLAYLKQGHIGFQHNDLKTRNVFVNVDKTGKPTFLLADFDKSAISWGNLRFFNDSMYLADLPTLSYDGVIQTLTNSIPTRSTSMVGKSIAPYTMYNPRGYYSTYDLYTFLFSMLFDANVHTKLTYEVTGSFLEKVVNTMCGHQPKIMTTVNKYMETARKTEGEDLLSITNISGIMHKNNFAIRLDLEQMIKDMGLKMYQPNNGLADRAKWTKVHTSKGGRICLGKPDIPKGRCTTQKYKYLGMKYDYDNI